MTAQKTASRGNRLDELHKEVAERVVAEIAKTLTNHPIDRIDDLLAAH